MATPTIAPKPFLDYVEAHSTDFIKRLAEAVAIKSVSSDAQYRTEVIQMSNWMKTHLEIYGVTTTAIELGTQAGAEDLQLPPVIVGRIGTDPAKKTVLVYGHLDVQPVGDEKKWTHDPFTLTLDKGTGKMLGRGSTDDKGPVLGWLNVLEAHHKQDLELPVNMRFCFEAMEESSSEGLDDFIANEAAKGDQGWFDMVDCVCISDNYWLNTTKPCLTYGLRGIVYVEVWVTGPKTKLHSGIYGGMVYEPMTALIALLNTLVQQDTKIKITDAYKGIEAPDDSEIQAYEEMEYSVEYLQSTAGDVAVSDDKVTLLMNRMRWPSLSIHGIQGAVSDPGTVTTIPDRVAGKFSLRIVPPQTPESVKKLVDDYLREQFKNLGTKCSIKEITYQPEIGGDAWVTDYNHWNYQAAAAATRDVYKTSPEYTREGGSIPVTLTLENNIKDKHGEKVNVLLLPMGRGDDNAHSEDEKLDVSNFISGSQLLGTYLYALAGKAVV